MLALNADHLGLLLWGTLHASDPHGQLLLRRFDSTCGNTVLVIQDLLTREADLRSFELLAILACEPA